MKYFHVFVSGNGQASGSTMAMVRMPGTMVLSRTYSSELADRTSAAFKEVERLVCDEVNNSLITWRPSSLRPTTFQ